MKRSTHVAAWVLLAVSTLVLWPERWGGSMTYVITSGNSMAPTWRAGDLAVLRAADDYDVGDVAAYDSSDIKSVVMHRIEEESSQGYTFKGDNNDHLDPETVQQEQVLGRLLLRVPGVGKQLSWILEPVNLMLAGAALYLLLGDRKQRGTTPASAQREVGRLRLRSLELPATTLTAELAEECDLQRLAEQYDRPILEVEGDERRYVVDGAVVYTWTQAAVRPSGRRATPQGRDWDYGGRHLQAVPSPRAAVPGEDVRVS